MSHISISDFSSKYEEEWVEVCYKGKYSEFTLGLAGLRENMESVWMPGVCVCVRVCVRAR